MASAIASAAGDDNKPRKIALNLIKADKALQPRVEMDREHQERMARAYVEGEDVPPPVHVFWDGKFYWLVDGFHRYHAMWTLRHMGAKFNHIRAIVHNGTKREAIVYAAQANLDNRSKPMNNADRKKAMWMLMDDEEWRKKSGGTIAKFLSMSPSVARKYWIEYHEVKGLAKPEYCESFRGRMRPIVHRKRASGVLPKIIQAGNTLEAKVDGQRFILGPKPDEAQRRLQEIVDQKEKLRLFYETNKECQRTLIRRHLNPSPVSDQGTNSRLPGVYGMNVRGVAVTTESFRSKPDAVAAIGRAVCCREKIGATRTVILCPVEDGPPEVLELGRKAGIEFMTIEDFIASLQGENKEGA